MGHTLLALFMRSSMSADTLRELGAAEPEVVAEFQRATGEATDEE